MTSSQNEACPRDLGARVALVEAVGALVESFAQPVALGLVFAAVDAASDAQIAVDAGLELVAHLFAIDRRADRDAAAQGGDAARPSWPQAVEGTVIRCAWGVRLSGSRRVLVFGCPVLSTIRSNETDAGTGTSRAAGGRRERWLERPRRVNLPRPCPTRSPSASKMLPPPPAASRATPTARRCCARARRTQRAGAELFFKCENLQRVGAFKFRGAFNAVSQLDSGAAPRGRGRVFVRQPRAGDRARRAAARHAGDHRHAA